VRARIAPSLLALVVVGCGGEHEPPLPPGAAVLVVGDSITAGYGLNEAAAWPARLAARTGWRVVAAGVSGDTTAGARDRLPALLDEHAPELVLLELGGNDLLRRVPDATIARNLDDMIGLARGHGARVALIAAPRPSAAGALTGLAAADVYRDVARRNGVALAEKALASVLSDERLRQDPIHPNGAGHEALARRVADELAAGGLYAPK